MSLHHQKQPYSLSTALLKRTPFLRTWLVPTHSYWYRYLQLFYRSRISAHSRVLHINCHDGYLFHAVKPSYGIGISPTQKEFDSVPFPVQFLSSISHIPTGTVFDYIIISEQSFTRYSRESEIAQYRTFMHDHTSIFIEENKPSSVSCNKHEKKVFQGLWYDHTAAGSHIIIPWYIPFISTLFNYFFVIFFPKKIRLRHWSIFQCRKDTRAITPSLSIIIPCRNEKGNIERTVKECPTLGSFTEIIFIEGHSTDGTYKEIERVAQKYSHKKIIARIQSGKGKANAVYEGCAKASGDIIVILDGDLTVSPSDVTLFFNALASGTADTAIGNRLSRGRPHSMPFLNYCANIFFAKLLSLLVYTPLDDTLCGMKAFWRHDAHAIANNHLFIGIKDPFGDFDILCNSARLCRRTTNIPVAYHMRTYGKTNIHHFYEVWFLLYFCLNILRRFTIY